MERKVKQQMSAIEKAKQTQKFQLELKELKEYVYLREGVRESEVLAVGEISSIADERIPVIVVKQGSVEREYITAYRLEHGRVISQTVCFIERREEY
jgi:hypothetical protein